MKRVVVDVRGVPTQVVAHATNDAGLRGMTLNDAVVGVVAGRYGIPYEPTGYPAQQTTQNDQFFLRMPSEVRDALRAHARAVGGTITGCVILSLQQHYGLPQDSPKRRGPPGLDADLIAEARRRNTEGGESVRSLAKDLGVTRGALTKALRGGAT